MLKGPRHPEPSTVQLTSRRARGRTRSDGSPANVDGFADAFADALRDILRDERSRAA
jgi:hypothetical protein